MKTILFITPYPSGAAPSQRFRFEQYYSVLKSKGFTLKWLPFLNTKQYDTIRNNPFSFLSLFYLTLGLSKRFFQLFLLPSCDFVFIHREASLLGPPCFEWALAKIRRKKIIYDFDDAIWLSDPGESTFISHWIKWKSKTSLLCRISHRLSCGNRYLREFGSKFNPNSILNPTTIDTDHLHNPSIHSPSQIIPQKNKSIVLGWTGSGSTLIYLKQIEPVIQEIEKLYPIIFLVIADKKPDLNITSLLFQKWNKDTEIPDLLHIDIGLMPLTDDLWSKGKCGFKLLQYMALEIPALASPVGVNTSIINQGINGFICNNQQEWKDYLIQLIEDETLRKTMGKEGRKKVEENYSVSSNASNFLSLFD